MPGQVREVLRLLAILIGKDGNKSEKVVQRGSGEKKLDALIRGNVQDYYNEISEKNQIEMCSLPYSRNSVGGNGEPSVDTILSYQNKCGLCLNCRTYLKNNGLQDTPSKENLSTLFYTIRFLYETITLIRKLCFEIDQELVRREKLIEGEAQSDSTIQEKEGARKSLPLPNLLGVKDQGIVTGALDFIGLIGFHQHCIPGFIPSFNALDSTTASCPLKLGHTISESILLFCTEGFYQFSKNSVIGPLVQSRSLANLVAGLIQLGYSDRSSTKDRPFSEYETSKIKELTIFKLCCAEKHCLCTVDNPQPYFVCIHVIESCREKMVNLLESLYQPLLVKVLLLLQKGTSATQRARDISIFSEAEQSEIMKNLKILKGLCGKILTQLLLKEKGVISLVQVLCDGCDLETLPWQKSDSIGKLVATCPRQVDSVEDYYCNICKQILNLLSLSGQEHGKHVLRIIGSCVSHMTLNSPSLTRKYFFTPLMQPWLTIQSKESYPDVPESKVLKSIENIHKVFVLSIDPAEHVMRILKEISNSLFQLYCFTKDSISVLQSLARDLLLRLIEHINIDEAVDFLKIAVLGVTFQITGSQNNSYVTVRDIDFEYGENGGVKIRGKERNLPSDENEDSTWRSTELSIVCVVSLFKSLKRDEVVSELFLSLLGYLSLKGDDRHTKSSSLFPDEEIENLQKDISLISLLSALGEEFGPSLLKNQSQIGTFVKLAIEKYCRSMESESTTQTSATFEESSCSLALGLLAVLLGQDEPLNYEFFEDILPFLQRLSNRGVDDHLSNTAEQLYFGIATRGAVWTKLHQEKRNQRVESGDVSDMMSDRAYDEALRDLKDALLPTRGHALFQLAKMLDIGNQKAQKEANRLLEIFRENIIDDDSYIYLAAVQGMASLSSRKHGVVIPFLCREFAMFPKKEGCREENNGRYSTELRLKLGESLMKATKDCGELVSLYSEVLLSSFLTGVKDSDALIRASSLSNIGETCRLLKFSVGSIIHEIFTCISGVVLTDPEKEVRRAATAVVTELLRGLGQNAVTVLEDVIKDLYRLLKRVQTNDVDEITKAHAGNALTELEIIMRENLFRKPDLKKEIRILP